MKSRNNNNENNNAWPCFFLEVKTMQDLFKLSCEYLAYSVSHFDLRVLTWIVASLCLKTIYMFILFFNLSIHTV